MSNTKHHAINPAMHYTVVIALIISLITTFLLGMLLTETLWGGGLGYFSDYARQNTIERRREAFYDNIKQQLQAQGASAAQLGGSNQPIHFGSNFDSMMDDLVRVPSPLKHTITYFGHVDYADDPQGLLGNNGAPGTPIVIKTIVPQDATDSNWVDGEASYAFENTDSILTIGSYEFEFDNSNSHPMVTQYNGEQDQSSIEDWDYLMTYRASTAYPFSDPISSDEIPEYLNERILDAWGVDNLFIDKFDRPEDPGYWIVNGSIDRVLIRYE